MKQPLESVRPWDLKNLHFKGTRSGKETRSGCFSRGCRTEQINGGLETAATLWGEGQSTAAQPCVRGIFRDSQLFSSAKDPYFDTIGNKSLS
jgi:hypothetical protein